MNGSLSVVASVLGLAMLLGGAVAVLFSQLRRNTTQIVREENQDLRDRLRTVEQLEEECKERLTKAETTIQVVSDMVTGASAVAELATLVAFNHDEMLRRLDRLDERMERGQP